MLVCISWYLICKSSLSFQIPKPIFEVVDMDTKDTRPRTWPWQHLPHQRAWTGYSNPQKDAEKSGTWKYKMITYNYHVSRPANSVSESLSFWGLPKTPNVDGLLWFIMVNKMIFSVKITILIHFGDYPGSMIVFFHALPCRCPLIMWHVESLVLK